MIFTQTELSILAEALETRIKTGEFSESESNLDECIFGSMVHLTALNNLADKVVSMQEFEQDDADMCASNI